MKESKLLRFLDKYVGSIICLVFSGINKLRFKKKNKKIKNILFIELFEMGASIMSYPSLKYAKENVKNANLYCLTLKSMKGTWSLLGIIPEENIYTIEEDNIFVFIRSMFSNIWKLRKKNIDLTIDFELFMRVSSIISYMIKSEYRAGFFRYEYEGLYRGNFMDFKCAFNQNLHISKNFLALTKTAIENQNEYPNYKSSIKASELVLPKYVPNMRLRNIIKEKVKMQYPTYTNNKIIAVAHDVGENLRMRNYPHPKLASVIKMLISKYPNHLILLIGVKKDWQSGELIRKKVNEEHCLNFSGMTPRLAEFFELLKMSEILICNDNGPAHFAAITKTKTLALFSTDSPFMYGPLGDSTVILYSYFHCSPCISATNSKQSKCKNNLCLQSIPPKQVYEFAVGIIEGKVQCGTINGNSPYY